MITLTPRGAGLVGASVLLWLVARSFGAAELQVAAVAALLLLVAAGLTLLAPIRLAVDRVVRPATLFFDTEALVEVVVTNTGRLRVAGLDVRDRLPPDLAEPPTTSLPPLAAGGRTVLSYRIRGARRGRFTLGPFEVTLVDPFGLVRRRRTLPSTAGVTVYPPVSRLPGRVPLGGSSSSARGGRRLPVHDGEEFSKVREYVRGDDLRSVHWASTAHRGRLMVRQGESSQGPRAVVLLDIRASRHTGAGATATIETAVAATASVGLHLTERGRSLVLVDRPLATPPPALPWEAWLERLADTATADVDLGDMLRQLGRGVAGDGALVAIVTVPDAEELRNLVRAGRNFATPLALLVDTARPGRGDGVTGAADHAVRALRAAGWRAGFLRQGMRIEEGWQELLLARRPASTAGVPGGGS